MASWILVPSLVSLRGEFNKLAPVRDKFSDGSIGDTSHAAGASDHNPDETGNTPTKDADDINEVHAIDVDVELNKAGWSMQRCVDIIVGNHRAGRDDRLQNVIYNRRIASRSWGWTWRDYTGTSPHTEHAHFSARYTTAQEGDTSPWGLLEAEEGTGVSKQDVIDALKSAEGRSALASAIRDMSISDKAYPTRTFGTFVNDLQYKRDYEVGDGAGAKYSGVKPGSFLNIVGKLPGDVAKVSAIVAAKADVDEKALALALAPALAPLILAGLPDGALSGADIEAAVRNVLTNGVGR